MQGFTDKQEYLLHTTPFVLSLSKERTAHRRQSRLSCFDRLSTNGFISRYTVTTDFFRTFHAGL
jgi:hypothetical protein